MTAQCDPNEDHEQYAGKVILDPWEDPAQTDWPDNPEGGNDGVGADGRDDQSPESDQSSRA